ncbi:GDSL esterase/lipase At5g55050 [Prosopis cineraria]|uniref:GDSL esterase/lipase At5g55050 n=1 Tax=Prosopis cineraria TaxID=364024 RepID=UPI002410B44C|nr:GDSL esterase/lipase At5g55050 [Prosopis cineraria]
MTCSVYYITFFFFFFFFFFLNYYCEAQNQKASALYVFGDSLVDVGNNNYLKLSIVKANHFPYGIDFPSKKPTGRFSNGKNAADFIAEELGLPTSPPYLSLVSESKANKDNVSIVGGASFASAGAGIFDGSDQRYKQSIPLRKQVDYYVEAHNEMLKQIGESALQEHLSSSIFTVVIGSNDLSGYFDSSNLRHKSTPQQYLDSMLFSLRAQLQRIYENGGRKFEIAGIGAVGCCPARRLKNNTECEAEINFWALKYNEGLKSMLQEWQSQNHGLAYTFFDTYAANDDLILNPSTHGFSEVRAACCGLGELRARAPCLPVTKFCSNRKDHVFWDQYHPTETASRILVDKIFNGPSQYTSPITLKELLHL